MIKLVTEFYSPSKPIVQPYIVPISDRMYRLEQNYVYEWKHGGKEYRIVILAGMEYDGASVPQFLWWIGIRPDGLLRAAALVHDFIYGWGGSLPEGQYQFKSSQGQWLNIGTPWSRKAADRIFARIMREAGVAQWKRRWAYRAVRWFGNKSFNSPIK